MLKVCGPGEMACRGSGGGQNGAGRLARMAGRRDWPTLERDDAERGSFVSSGIERRYGRNKENGS